MEIDQNVIKKINKACEIFEDVFQTFESKILLLKNIIFDSNYLNKINEYKIIHDSIKLLEENAINDDTRKHQQQYLFDLVNTFMKDPSYEELLKYFKENQQMLSLFCLLFVHFQNENNSDEQKKAHDFMLNPMLSCAKKLINFIK